MTEENEHDQYDVETGHSHKCPKPAKLRRKFFSPHGTGPAFFRYVKKMLCMAMRHNNLPKPADNMARMASATQLCITCEAMPAQQLELLCIHDLG